MLIMAIENNFEEKIMLTNGQNYTNILIAVKGVLMNNGNFKIKISTIDWEIELEGDSQTVIEQFEKLRTEGLGTLTPRFSKLHQPQNHSYEKEEYESLNNVVTKGLPGTEIEWILLYAFYASNFGVEKFDREDILVKYKESERLDKSRKSNLSNNIIAAKKRNWIMELTEKQFRLTDEGKRKVIEILERKSSPKPVRPFKKKDKKQDENKSPQS